MEPGALADSREGLQSEGPGLQPGLLGVDGTTADSTIDYSAVSISPRATGGRQMVADGGSGASSLPGRRAKWMMRKEARPPPAFSLSLSCFIMRPRASCALAVDFRSDSRLPIMHWLAYTRWRIM